MDPKQAKFGYWFVYAAGAIQLIGTAALFVYGTSVVESCIAVMLALSGLLFLAVARVLGAKKGAVTYYPATEQVVVTGKDGNDTAAFSMADLVGILVRRRKEFWGKSAEPVLVSSVELATRQGLSLFLLETPTLEEAEEAALYIRQAVKLPVVHDDDLQTGPGQDAARPSPPQGFRVRKLGRSVEMHYGTGTRWALSVPIAITALFCLASSALLLGGVKTTGVLGFLFGPVAGLLGICFALLWTFKGWGRERLVVHKDRIEHSFHLGSKSWGQQKFGFSKEGIAARFRSRGALGFSLELMSGGKIAVVGTGSTRASNLPPGSLIDLGNYVISLASSRK